MYFLHLAFSSKRKEWLLKSKKMVRIHKLELPVERETDKAFTVTLRETE